MPNSFQESDTPIYEHVMDFVLCQRRRVASSCPKKAGASDTSTPAITLSLPDPTPNPAGAGVGGYGYEVRVQKFGLLEKGKPYK